MSLLSDLADAYGNAWNQMTPTVKGGGGTASSNLLDALNASGSGYIPTPQTMAQQQATGISANPQIVPITDAQANAAQTQQGVATPDAARVAAMQQQAGAQTPAVQAAPQAAADPGLQTQNVTPTNVASVNATPGFPSPSDYNADGSQAQGGGLIGALAGTATQAANDPVQAKGLLSSLGDYASGIGAKLKSMSPAASQALIATGLSILGNNDGTHNLASLVGQGGIAGLNQYQAVNQNLIGNQLARQKLAQDLAEKQATNATANFNAETERAKAMNQPVTLNPGQSVGTVAGLANGQLPTQVGGPVVARTVETTDGQGNVFTQGVDAFGRPVGQPIAKTLVYTGPLNNDQQKIVNDANTTSNQSALNLTKTQNFIKQLVPTIPDPNNPGQTIPNPDYVPVQGGVAATAANELNKLTGGQTQSQLLRQQIQQNVRLGMLQGYKAGVGGRLTNTDINLLQQGMPPDNASGTALLNYLTAYSHLQEDQATHDAMNAQYITANRGDSSPLHAPATIAGQQYPAGTTMQQVLSRQAPVQSGNGNASAQQAQGIIAKAQQAARSGDANAQAALKQRGLSW